MNLRERQGADETSPPTISASGRGRCRAAGRLADRLGAGLSDAAGADHRWRGRGRHSSTSSRASWVNGCRNGSVSHSSSRTGRAQAPISPPKRSFVLPPDGYTLLSVSPSNAINATLYEKLNFIFIRDIAPVAGIIRAANVMVVNPSVPAKTVPEFIAYAKANPASSTCRRPATEPRNMSPANCSK